jgi:hypothetical protein
MLKELKGIISHSWFWNAAEEEKRLLEDPLEA